MKTEINPQLERALMIGVASDFALQSKHGWSIKDHYAERVLPDKEDSFVLGFNIIFRIPSEMVNLLSDFTADVNSAVRIILFNAMELGYDGKSQLIVTEDMLINELRPSSIYKTKLYGKRRKAYVEKLKSAMNVIGNLKYEIQEIK